MPRRGPRSRRPDPRREALGRAAAALSLGEGKATLQPREQPRCSARCAALELRQLPVAEARSQLQALLFGMAQRIESLERRLEGPWWGLGAGGQLPGTLAVSSPPPEGAPGAPAWPVVGAGAPGGDRAGSRGAAAFSLPAGHLPKLAAVWAGEILPGRRGRGGVSLQKRSPVPVASTAPSPLPGELPCSGLWFRGRGFLGVLRGERALAWLWRRGSRWGGRGRCVPC